jgi:hypothetical protein
MNKDNVRIRKDNPIKIISKENPLISKENPIKAKRD